MPNSYQPTPNPLITMYLHFSDLETALLPYFLFVVYGAIALWAMNESAHRTYVKPEPEPATTDDLNDVSVTNDGEPEVEVEQMDFVLTVPCPWTPDLTTQFEMERVSRAMQPSELESEDTDYLTQELQVPVAEPATDVVLEYREQKARQPKKKRSTLSELIALEIKRTEPSDDSSN